MKLAAGLSVYCSTLKQRTVSALALQHMATREHRKIKEAENGIREVPSTLCRVSDSKTRRVFHVVQIFDSPPSKT